MDLYAENILDHYRHPRCKSELQRASGEEFSVVHSESNPTCGDELTVALKISDDAIQEISWDGIGCAISQAGMSMFSEELEGMKTSEVLTLSKDDIYELLGVPIGPRRFKCALICLHTVKNALRQAEGLEPQSWLDTVEIAEA